MKPISKNLLDLFFEIIFSILSPVVTGTVDLVTIILNLFILYIFIQLISFLAYRSFVNEIDQISKVCSGLRRLCSASIDLAYVAAGKLDAFWERNLNLWDMGAGVLLIKEAGGKVTEPSGKPWTLKSKDILASNSILHDEIKKKLVISK